MLMSCCEETTRIGRPVWMCTGLDGPMKRQRAEAEPGSHLRASLVRPAIDRAREDETYSSPTSMPAHP
jgi:hypothetical protein